MAAGTRRPVSRASGPARRRLVLGGLVVVVAMVHLDVADHLLSTLPRGMAATSAARPQAIDVQFVHELRPAAPPRPGPGPAAVLAAPHAAAPVAVPASSPAPAAGAVAEAPTEVEAGAARDAARVGEAAPAASAAREATDGPPEVSVAEAAGPEAAASGIEAPGAPFEWPPSTRLSYALTGQVRGPVEGQARVEWRREGARYQVEVVVEVGPWFAPLVSRRVVSDGEITPEGLHPLRYDEETRVAWREPRRVLLELDGDRIVLADGREVPRPDGVQDSASQFVHLTWLFTTQPWRLEPGSRVELPLALPRRVEPWVYDVAAREWLETPFGSIETLHVRPRRAPVPGQDLVAEMWIAPTLQYLPVRVVIRQDDATWIDLRVSRLPEQAAVPATAR